jgi:general secretion pathway protein L
MPRTGWNRLLICRSYALTAFFNYPMATIENDMRLFGLDLRHLGRDVGATWSALQHSWLLSWLTPAPDVQLLQVDRTTRLWRMGDKPVAMSGVQSSARFSAVELPEDVFLFRELALPAGLDTTQLRAAVDLDLQSASPFAPHDLLWGYVIRRGGDATQKALIAIASRKQVDAYLQSLDAKLTAPMTPTKSAASLSERIEVWALSPATRQPLVLRGFGEKLRERYVRSQRIWGYALLGLAACLSIAIAVTPTAQLRLRALNALHQHNELVQRTGPVVHNREILLQSAEKLKALSDEFSARIDPLRVIEMLTTVLPDDTFLHAFKLQGNKVTLVGQTANASALLQLLGAQPGLRDVKAPSAANRAPGSSKDSYVIEFLVDPASFAVATVKTVAPTPPLPAEAASAAEATAPAASAGLAPATPVAAPSPQPSFGGGGPSFGGAPTRAAPPPASRATGPGKT